MAICKFFQKGNCRNGDRCRFEHITPSGGIPPGGHAAFGGLIAGAGRGGRSRGGYQDNQRGGHNGGSQRGGHNGGGQRGGRNDNSRGGGNTGDQRHGNQNQGDGRGGRGRRRGRGRGGGNQTNNDRMDDSDMDSASQNAGPFQGNTQTEPTYQANFSFQPMNGQAFGQSDPASQKNQNLSTMMVETEIYKKDPKIMYDDLMISGPQWKYSVYAPWVGANEHLVGSEFEVSRTEMRLLHEQQMAMNRRDEYLQFEFNLQQGYLQRLSNIANNFEEEILNIANYPLNRDVELNRNTTFGSIDGPRDVFSLQNVMLYWQHYAANNTMQAVPLPVSEGAFAGAFNNLDPASLAPHVNSMSNVSAPAAQNFGGLGSTPFFQNGGLNNSSVGANPISNTAMAPFSSGFASGGGVAANAAFGGGFSGSSGFGAGFPSSSGAIGGSSFNSSGGAPATQGFQNPAANPNTTTLSTATSFGMAGRTSFASGQSSLPVFGLAVGEVPAEPPKDNLQNWQGSKYAPPAISNQFLPSSQRASQFPTKAQEYYAPAQTSTTGSKMVSSETQTDLIGTGADGSGTKVDPHTGLLLTYKSMPVLYRLGRRTVKVPQPGANPGSGQTVEVEKLFRIPTVMELDPAGNERVREIEEFAVEYEAEQGPDEDQLKDAGGFDGLLAQYTRFLRDANVQLGSIPEMPPTSDISRFPPKNSST